MGKPGHHGTGLLKTAGQRLPESPAGSGDADTAPSPAVIACWGLFHGISLGHSCGQPLAGVRVRV